MSFADTAEAVAAAGNAADKDWKTAANEALRFVAERQETLTSKDVFDELDKTTFTTRENRAMGSIMAEAKKLGIITPTNLCEDIVRSSGHKGVARVWKSNLFKKVAA